MSFVRRELAGGGVALVADEAAADGYLVAFSERSGGSSRPPFHSLNIGVRVGDDPAAVQDNRERLARGLGVRGFATARQVHGTAVAVARGPAGSDSGADLGDADVLVASGPGTAVAVLTADCLPIALVAPASGSAAAVHAGWRGLAAGAIEAGIGALETGARDLRAWIGPAIGPCHYEVGLEVLEVIGRRTRPVVASRSGDRAMLDLPATAERLLTDLGVARVERTTECTACEPDRFYSYRREGRTGRQAAVVSML